VRVEAIPGASLCVLPGCGHAAHLEREDWFNAVVADFLDQP
jgi:pimeloyl-ACP methyl ester carboxylesterase